MPERVEVPGPKVSYLIKEHIKAEMRAAPEGERKFTLQELDRWITGLEIDIDRYYEYCRLNDLDSGD